MWPLMIVIFLLAGRRLRLVLYADGITPGNVISPDNKRKSIVWYVSFIEFGDKLMFEELWVAVALARTCCQTRSTLAFCNCSR